MKFLSEIYPNVKFFEKESDTGQVYYGVERNQLQKRVHTGNFVFIHAGYEYNTRNWVAEVGNAYRDVLHVNKFEYALEKENVEELYRELISNPHHKNQLGIFSIRNFHDFQQTNSLPKAIHEFVLRYLQEENRKQTLLNDATWEDSFTYCDDNEKQHLVVLNAENGYVYEDEIDFLIQEKASFKNDSSSSKLYLTTEGDLIQDYHAHSRDDLEHHMTVLRVIEGEEKERYLQTVFAK
ncbi:hypothetical protein [Bacillus cereus]|uniref:hypothetical protein n=1 Tax=Bacillus cereus TaxID=1396 RepID=UPI001F414ADE|nr:hypothetical protein [Bacillus cereus]BCC44643.1 hypothetical protein BCJMU01_p220 [Bacillus cereus]